MSSDQLFSKILIPIDGSEPSFHAADIASNIANKFNSESIVLYVVVAPSPSEYAREGFQTCSRGIGIPNPSP